MSAKTYIPNSCMCAGNFLYGLVSKPDNSKTLLRSASGLAINGTCYKLSYVFNKGKVPFRLTGKRYSMCALCHFFVDDDDVMFTVCLSQCLIKPKRMHTCFPSTVTCPSGKKKVS